VALAGRSLVLGKVSSMFGCPGSSLMALALSVAMRAPVVVVPDRTGAIGTVVEWRIVKVAFMDRFVPAALILSRLFTYGQPPRHECAGQLFELLLVCSRNVLDVVD
jgi:hypothetical protein